MDQSSRRENHMERGTLGPIVAGGLPWIPALSPGHPVFESFCAIQSHINGTSVAL
jgi:hypothetical protein